MEKNALEVSKITEKKFDSVSGSLQTDPSIWTEVKKS